MEALNESPGPRLHKIAGIVVRPSSIISHSKMDAIRSHPLSQHAFAFWREHWPLIVGVPLAWFTYMVYKYVLRVRFFSKTRNYPGPDHGHWFFGQAAALISGPGLAQVGWHKQYGPVVRFSGAMPGRETISFTSYSALKQVLVDRAYEYPKPPFVRDVLGIAAGYGLLTLEGPDHTALRRFMNQAFAFKYLHEQFDSYYKPINSLIDILDKKTKEGKDGETELEITKLMDSTLMDIICLTAFGFDCDSLHNPDQPLASSYHKLVNIQSGENILMLFCLLSLPGGPAIIRRAVNSPTVARLVNRFVKPYAREGSALHPLCTFVENLNNVNHFSAELLESKMAEARQLKKASGGQFAMDVSGGKVDVLSLLVRASLDEGSSYKMNATMLQAQMLTFLGAGHETTASGAAWAVWELAANQEIQTKLRKECQELIARNNNPGWQDIKHLSYLNAVVQETMRVRPPTPQTAREASKDSTIDGVFVPKGMTISIPIRSVNFDENIWGADAREFKPERWLNLPQQYSSVFSK